MSSISTSTSIRQVFVVGAGHMGGGIAQVTATAGLNVTLYDVSADAVRGTLEKMRWSLGKLHSKGLIPESADTVMARIKPTDDLAAAAAADLVIEAIPEVESLKRDVFARLDAICPPHVPFASNTSAIPITNIAAATRRAANFCGLHFFNPVPMLALVEVVRGQQTSDACVEMATAFVRQIGKEPVLVRRDKTGFIVNRILGAALAEAMRLVESGQADATDIDRAMRLGCAWKMGPLETADLAGLDVVLNMFEAMQLSELNPVLAPPSVLKELVAAGNFGRKTGRGFYDHSPKA